MRKELKSKKNWREANKSLGIRLGYPKCCVDEFCAHTPIELMRDKALAETYAIRKRASYVDGIDSNFLPCASHARMILQGAISIHSLIENRSDQFKPFPHEDGITIDSR